MTRDQKIIYFNNVFSGILKPITESNNDFAKDIQFSYAIARVYDESRNYLKPSKDLEFQLFNMVYAVCIDDKNPIHRNFFTEHERQMYPETADIFLPVINRKLMLVKKEPWWSDET